MKKLLAAVLLLCASACAYGQGATILFPPVTDSQGHGVPFVTINFCTTPTTVTNGVCNTPVTVFQNQTLSTPYSSAIQTDGLGNFPPNVNTATAIWFSPAANYCYSLSGSITATNICYPFSVPIATGSSPTFANITAQSYDNIQTITSLTSGADICAKIATGIAVGPSTGVIVDARFFQGIQACASNPLASISGPVNLLLGQVTIQSSVQWVDTADKVKIKGSGKGQTILQYTGGAIASFVKFGTATPTVNQLFEVSLEDMTIKGSANVTDTVFITGVHHSLFARLDLKDATRACFHSQFSVMPTLNDVECSLNTGAFIQQPANGILLDQIDANHQTTAGFVEVPKVEGVSGSGIKLTGSSGMTFTAGTSEQNNRGIEVTVSVNNGNIFDGTDLENNTVEDVLDSGVSTEYRTIKSTKSIHLAGASQKVKGGNNNSYQIDAGTNNSDIDSSWNFSGTGTVLDNGAYTRWHITNPATGSVQSVIAGSGSFGGGAGTETNGWSFRDVIPPANLSGLGTPNPTDMLRGSYLFTTGGNVLSTTPITTSAIWRLIFIGDWSNNVEGGGLAQPALIQEVTSASPTLTIGSLTLTFSKNGSNQFVGTTSASSIGFVGTIIASVRFTGAAGTASALFKGSVVAPGLPQAIGSGTAAMTTAGILTGACGTTVTVAATGVLTTDTINIARNAAATIGNGGGLTLNYWPTSGNVNFNYCNSSAGTITPTGMTVNWSVLR